MMSEEHYLDTGDFSRAVSSFESFVGDFTKAVEGFIVAVGSFQEAVDNIPHVIKVEYPQEDKEG
jgi:hypothetical protein